MAELDIQQLRSAIDAIDDDIIRLLIERSSLVRNVGALKKKTQAKGVSFIRPGREADMVRRIADAFKKGEFPPAAAAQIWRTIICASLSLESNLSVTAFAPENQHEIYWLAREYFGSFTPVTKEPTSKRVLGDVIDGKVEVGVLPPPDDSHEGSWWPRLPEGVKVFACVPFVLGKGEEIKAYAVAKLEPEETGNDITLLCIETDMDVSQSRLKTTFDKLNVDVHWLAVESFRSSHRTHLVEIKGFVTAKDKPMLAFREEIGASVLAIRELGAYAAPIIL